MSVTHTRVIYLGFLLSEWFGSFLLGICLVIGITFPLSPDVRTVGDERFASYLPWSAIASSESGMRVISVGFLMSELFEVPRNVFTGVMYLGFWMVEVSGKVSYMGYVLGFLDGCGVRYGELRVLFSEVFSYLGFWMFEVSGKVSYRCYLVRFLDFKAV